MLQFPILASFYHLPCLLRFLISPNLHPEFCISNETCNNMRLNSLGQVALATNIYVSSYSGFISTLQLDQHPRSGYSLTSISSNNGSEPSPSWLELAQHEDIIFCVDEGLSVPNGSIASYKNTASGKLKLIDRHTTISGPVSTIIYNGGKALVAAH